MWADYQNYNAYTCVYTETHTQTHTFLFKMISSSIVDTALFSAQNIVTVTVGNYKFNVICEVGC